MNNRNQLERKTVNILWRMEYLTSIANRVQLVFLSVTES